MSNTFTTTTTWIKQVETYNSGGGCMIDLITLKDGEVIACSDEAVCVFKNMDAYHENDGDLEKTIWLSELKPAPPLEIKFVKVLETGTNELLGYLVYPAQQMVPPELRDSPDAYMCLMDFVEMHKQTHVTRTTEYR